MPTESPQAVYRARQAHWDAAIAAHESRHLLISNLRLALFAVFAVVVWLALGPRALSIGWCLAPLAAFAVLAALHAQVLNARERAVRARAYFVRGLSRLDETWKGEGADGARFLEDHPYARDLDVFGDASLFQLLNTTRTETGEETLARWLKTPAAIETIAERQAAVAELRDRLDFRESMAIFAAETRVSRTGSLAVWSHALPAGLTAVHGALFALAGIVSTVTTVLIWREIIPLAAGVVLYLFPAALGLIYRLRVHRALTGVDAAADDLALLAGLLGRVEAATFSAPRLVALRGQLVTDGVPPSRRIAHLQFYLAARDSLRNEFTRPFAMLLQVRGQAAAAVDRWHAAHRRDLAVWLETIGELEALCALATFAFEHPDHPFPSVVPSGAPFLSAEAIAHPLLPATVAVANDVALGAEAPRVLIVSGSNMSGKSTLLRAVGINVVLALAGAPVRARRMTLSPVTPGATLRVQDSLDEGQSRFYAEILRIRDIVATARQTPTLFLLDEILHGTNSHDRRIGAEGIVRSLEAAGAIGIVTTHDLALTSLVESLPAAKNVHFQDTLEAGRLSFDYKMRDGVVERSNAIELMRAVGIDV